jgi:hypothetical protein
LDSHSIEVVQASLEVLVRSFIGEEYLAMAVDEHDGGNPLSDNSVKVDPKVNFLDLSMEL